MLYAQDYWFMNLYLDSGSKFLTFRKCQKGQGKWQGKK